MHSDRRLAGCKPLLLSALLLTFAGAAQATLFASSAAGYAEPHTASLTFFNGATGTLSAISTTSPGGLAAAGGYGEAAYGALHSSADAVISSDAQARGQGSSLWIDNITLWSSFTGPATARASFSLSGGLSSRVGPSSTGALANSTIASRVTVNGTDVLSVSGQLVSRNGVIETDEVRVNGANVSFTPGSLAGTYFFDMPVTLGTPFTMVADLTAFVQAMGSSGLDDAAAHSSFGSTGRWGGISSLVLADGTTVSDFSVTSASGFDWSRAYGADVTAPVPEPETYALMLAGLALLGSIARRRRT